MHSTEPDASTTVLVVGAGVSGLTIANRMLDLGIPTVVLERRDRERLEQRQRAGNVEPRAVAMLRRWGMEDVLTGTEVPDAYEYRVDTRPRTLRLHPDPDWPKARFTPQQALVTRLLARYLDGGGDVRFEVTDVTLDDLDTGHPRVGCTDADGRTHRWSCELVAGCDGDRGATRAAVPDGVLTRHEHDWGLSWVNVLAETTGPPRMILAVSDRGHAATFPRGPGRARWYLQCDPADTAADWPDDRIRTEIARRIGEDQQVGAVVEKEVFALRAAVTEPMSYGRLYLVGDAAHIISPVTAKGMNMALHDAEVFADAAVGFVTGGDDAGLREYSVVCLRRVWAYQSYAAWNSEVLHDSAADFQPDGFRRGIARARLERLLTSPGAAVDYSEMMAGMG